MQDNLFTESSDQRCPYCGEPIQLIVEPLDEPQNYVEDCQVCCRPMVVDVNTDGSVYLQREDD